MTDDIIYRRSVRQLADDLDRGLVTSVDLVDAVRARVAAYDAEPPGLNAIRSLNPEARAHAQELDRERREGNVRGPLHGIPVVVKDNVHVKGLPTSAGTAALLGWMAKEDAEVIRRLEAAGAVVVAKTNLHELAAGLTTVGSAGGRTRNPFDPSRTPGGSSGGTAAAVAASYAPMGMGTDTCGSIRIPASHCGLFGLRPTQGLGPMQGIVPLSSSQDVVGPLARTAYGLAVGLDAVLADRFVKASGTSDQDAPFARAASSAPPPGLRVGVVLSMFAGRSARGRRTRRVVMRALERLRALGHEVVPVQDHSLGEHLRNTSLILHEFKFDLADHLSEHPGAPIQSLDDLLAAGLHHVDLDARFKSRARPLSRDTAEARAVRERRKRLRDYLGELMVRDSLDMLAYPSSSAPAPRIGEPPVGSNAALAAHTGFPAISVPAGTISNGLPVGLELLANTLKDDLLVSVAAALEPGSGRRPEALSVPPLRDGNPPGLVRWRAEATAGSCTLRAAFQYDRRRGTLRCDWEVDGVEAADVLGLVLGLYRPSGNGPVLHALTRRQVSPGMVTVGLSAPDRDRLERGAMVLRLLTRDRPLGTLQLRVRTPSDTWRVGP